MGRLVLWDIDGTLVRVGEVGAAVFDRAIERAVGVAPPARVRMSGKTDPQIVRESLALLELDDGEHHVDAVLAHLESELAAASHLVRAEGRVLPGVHALLERIDEEGDLTQTVLTGNIAPNAMVKLSALGLDRWLDLDVGAYGSDDPDRRALVPIARDRVAAKYGRTFGDDEVWVVGDSTNDVRCARAAGVRCLAVATGTTPENELRALAPDALRRDLHDGAEIISLLRS